MRETLALNLLNWQFAQKGCFLFITEKSEQRHWVLHTRVSLGNKFQLKATIVIFFFSDQICPKREFPFQNGKNALVRVSMVVTYYIKLFRTGADRSNSILMSLLLLVAETTIDWTIHWTHSNFFQYKLKMFLLYSVK